MYAYVHVAIILICCHLIRTQLHVVLRVGRCTTVGWVRWVRSFGRLGHSAVDFTN